MVQKIYDSTYKNSTRSPYLLFRELRSPRQQSKGATITNGRPVIRENPVKWRHNFKEARRWPIHDMMAEICFQCDRNPRDPGDFLCWSCKEEHRLCFECGERERNLPFKLCTPCYEASKNSVPVRDGIIPTAITSSLSVFSSGTTTTATGWGMYVGTTLLHAKFSLTSFCRWWWWRHLFATRMH